MLAGPDTLGYRTTKFLRRHWVGASAAAAIVVVVAVAGTALWYSQQRAERRFNDVRQLANTLVGELYDSIAEVPGSTSARQLLVTRALGYLDALSREAGSDTSLKVDLADAYQKIGDVQGNPYVANLGDVAGARASYTKLVDLRSSIHQRARGRGRPRLRWGWPTRGLATSISRRASTPRRSNPINGRSRHLDEARGADGAADDAAEDRCAGAGPSRGGVDVGRTSRRGQGRAARGDSPAPAAQRSARARRG